MGEVYRARDTRLKREVAIKVLPAGISSDPDRLRRFEQEALATAALNHPNILAVFDIGTHEGAPYLVSELLEGETLREQLGRGKLAVRKAIDYGVQVARGLAAAHEKGIVHRDLKPENLFVTKDGRLKILDFGLAKLTQPQSASDPGAPTIGGETEPGVVMGTVGYMSPEQVRGQNTDHRTDIFSFGAILYEMLAGKRAFQKTTSADTMSAILNEDPASISQITTNIPPALLRVVHRCLEKNPEQRFQSASDLAFALDALSETSGYGSGAAIARPTKAGNRVVGLAAVAGVIVIVILIAGGFFLWRRWGVSRMSQERLSRIVHRQLTSSVPGDPVFAAAISRDGKYLAYKTALGKKTLILEIASGELRDLPAADAPIPYDWFPDGSHMLVRRLGFPGVWKVSIWDGSYRKILDEDLVFPVWISPDGSKIAYGKTDGREIWLMGSDGEDPRRILNAGGDEYVGWFAWSPRGHRLVYERSRGESAKGDTEIESCDLDGGTHTVVLSEPTLTGPDGQSPLAWLPDGRVIYTAHTSPSATTYDVWAVTVDPDTGKRQSDPSALTNWERSMPELFSASADGKRVIYDSHRDDDVLFLGDLRTPDKKLQSRRLTADEWTSYPGDWARDSGAVFFDSLRGGKWVVAKAGPDSGASEVVLSGAADYYRPALSPDGTRLLFSEKTDQPDPVRRLMSMPLGGGARSSILEGRHTYHCGRSASAGCVLGDVEGKELVFFMLDPVKGKGNEIQRVDSDPYATWSLSPDGTKIAIAPVVRDKWIRILSIPDHKVTDLPRSGTWEAVQHVTWAADGKHLFATAWSDPTGKFQSILYVDLQGNLLPLNEAKQGAGWFMEMEASPDGHYLAYTERLYSANITMLENF